MTEVTDRTFGFLVAFLLPGFVVLVALADHSPVVRSWLQTTEGPTVGGFLYMTLASVASGLTIGALRWLIVDSIHHCTGVRKPDWDLSVLQNNLAAFEGAVQNHYRYYQFYAGMCLATLFHLASPGMVLRLLSIDIAWSRIVLVALTLFYFVASRDALRKYYAATSALLSTNQTGKELRHDKRVASRRTSQASAFDQEG